MKVKRDTLLLIACLVWSAAGFNILRIGILAYPDYLSMLNYLLSLVVFTVFQIFIFGKLVKKHSALIFSVLKTSMMHPYTIDVDTIRCGPRGDPTFRWRPQGCPRFLTCPARAAASRDRRMT